MHQAFSLIVIALLVSGCAATAYDVGSTVVELMLDNAVSPDQSTGRVTCETNAAGRDICRFVD